MLKIDIISGFLGAGKTTFIKRLLNTELKNEKVVLIENEFGEISVDSEFLSDTGVNISEISQGCICCSLVGDFAKSLKEVIDTYNPTRIIVEPSGVGKLSDVIKAIENAGLVENLNTYICLVDATKAKVYAKNFKEFFADQIKHAKVVVLSRCDISKEEKIYESIDVVRKINADCTLVTTPINELSDSELLKVYECQTTSLLDELKHEHKHHHHHEGECECGCHHEHHHEHHHHHEEECECGCHHEHHHHHDEECECGCHNEHHHHYEEECECGCHHEHHHHHADEVFSSLSLETPKVYDFEELKENLNKLAYTKEFGYIVRAKGIVKTNLGWKSFNITPDELVISDNQPLNIGCVCVIGTDLEDINICNLFNKL